ncbi:glycosyl hydrolase [Streptomyces sp. B1866]|uniref:glycosyl hydrolase n=1 Tax=Streptomyces sp. B1866 TaxID=3075431 RepID=UPI0028915EBF|nr:glycosyl hydrolase [Streptomyces sp. B1866]MDT3398678.1 glycosyl hydrolase [Streptomyces sp. B1866]
MAISRIGARAAVLLATSTLLTGVGGAIAATSAVAAPASSAASCNFSNPHTVRTAKVDSINIQLRHSPSPDCAWGRIYNADKDDLVWVDRSSNGGQSWETLSVTRVKYGTDTHTASRYAGGRYIVRACAKNDTTSHVKCTRWF